MTREIKFRAWNKSECKMTDSFAIDASGSLLTYEAVQDQDMVRTIQEDDTANYVLIDTTNFYAQSNLILMQYTGLKDKNGVEIYEGDICTLVNPYTDKTAKGYARVVFSYSYDGGWVLTVDDNHFLNIGTRTNIIEVVGNIYENPD